MDLRLIDIEGRAVRLYEDAGYHADLKTTHAAPLVEEISRHPDIHSVLDVGCSHGRGHAQFPQLQCSAGARAPHVESACRFRLGVLPAAAAPLLACMGNYSVGNFYQLLTPLFFEFAYPSLWASSLKSGVRRGHKLAKLSNSLASPLL